MKHKLMIYIPLVLFISATIVLALGVFGQKTTNRIELPVGVTEPTPTTIVLPTLMPTIITTPTPIDPSVQIKSDLNSVMQDVGRVKVEDTRFKPPVFEFEMGI